MNLVSKIKVLGSSSQGNAYILECQNETLLLELGVSWKDIVKALNFDLSKIVACIVTHQHSDHAKSIKDAIKAGFPVYSTSEVQLIHPKVNVPKIGEKTRIGGFSIHPLSVPHSCECYAYIIQHEEFGKLVFATDCSAFKYKIKSVNHWLLEANYSEQILITKMCDNEMGRSLYWNHLELEDCINALKVNFSADTQSITLIHLSDTNSDEKEFVQRVKRELGFDNVVVADSGKEIEIQKSEF